MTNSTMPEHLYISYKGVDSHGYVAAYDNPITMGPCTNLTPYEYIRSDLAQGDASEPLEDGQYRWVKTGQHSGWVIAKVLRSALPGSFTFMFENGTAIFDDLAYKIGHVIRPPEAD